jgi:hypothetical protein
MHQHQFEPCIEALNACIAACGDCATAGMHETNAHAMADCILLNTDCMDICRLLVDYMERDSKMIATLCEACVDVCERCQEECDKYRMDYCRACAEACQACALECRAIIAIADGEYHHSPYSVIAGMRE